VDSALQEPERCRSYGRGLVLVTHCSARGGGDDLGTGVDDDHIILVVGTAEARASLTAF
jgi:hypothetical protein